MANSFEEKIIVKDNCKIHYWISRKTDKPWLIFLHGACADHRMFNDQINEFAENYSIMFWDARGHGVSRPNGKTYSIKLLEDDLLEIMENEAILKAIFIGQSMGGNLAQEMAFNNPDKVEKLVLVGCTCNTMKLKVSEKILIFLTPILTPFYPWKTILEESVKISSIKPRVQDYLRESFKVVGQKDFNKIFLATTACLHYEKKYRINKPMLLVCGESDNTGNIKKIVRTWSEQEPECEFHMIKDAGHCANMDNPKQFNKLLSGFL